MKIAFFDIDGTLLDVPHGLNAPSRATIEALKVCLLYTSDAADD